MYTNRISLNKAILVKKMGGVYITYVGDVDDNHVQLHWYAPLVFSFVASPEQSCQHVSKALLTISHQSIAVHMHVSQA